MTLRKTGSVLLCVLIVLLFCITATITPGVAFANTAITLDNTDVLKDLQGSALNGVPFRVEDYPYNPNGALEMLGFVEFGYSDYAHWRDGYGLYIYVYNPTLLNITTQDGGNRVSMATAYDDEGVPTSYEKFDLKVCSISTGVHANRFLKLKVIDGASFADRVSKAQRRYDVAELELYTYGDKFPTTLNIFKTFYFTGYAKGYGSTDEPLSSTMQEYDSIDLDVHHTSYLANITEKDHHNQVSSVYFAVPNRYFDTFGNLQKIKAEWYEYKLKNMLVTGNMDLYERAVAQAKMQFSGELQDYLRSNFYIGYSITKPPSFEIDGTIYEGVIATWAYGIYNGDSAKCNQYILPLSFYSEATDLYQIFKFLNKYKTAGDVGSSALLDAIYNYSNDLGNGYVDPEGKQISKDLFYDYVDDGRIMGYNCPEVDLGDTFDLKNYTSTHSWWEKLTTFWAHAPNFGPEYKDVAPIYDLCDADFEIDNNEFIARKLLVNDQDVDDLKAFYNAHKNTHHVILFRFATTDYFTKPVAFDLRRDSGKYWFATPEEKSKSYVCSETVFLNFDVISLTFRKDGVDRTFAVAADPIDVVGDLKPPAEPVIADALERIGQWFIDAWNKIVNFFKTSWKWILVALAGVVGLVIAVFVIKAIWSRPKVTVVNQSNTRSKKHGKKH